MTRGRRRALLLFVAACACGTKKDPPPIDASTPVEAGVITAQRVILDLPAHVDECVLGHDGVLLDLGAPNAHALYGIKETSSLEATEHDGATWDRVSSHTLSFRFAGPVDVQDRAEAFVDVRIRGLAARRFTVALNGKLVGSAPLTKGEIVVRSFHAASASLTSGTNELVLHFGGLGKAPDAAAEIDWIRVGAQAEAAYAAPTYDGAVATETLGGVPRRAIALRAPAFARCSVAIPRGATLEMALGLLGKGAGDVDVRVLRDRAAPMSLGKAHVDDASGWRPLSLSLPDEAQGVGALEIRIDQATEGARVLVADLKLRAPEHTKPTRARAARSVVVVVLGQTLSSATSLPTLSALAARSRTFDEFRATSTWAASSVASMLTGVLPFEHGADGDGSRLAEGVITVAEAAREAGISTAMFTANPTTMTAFGFARGFETFTGIVAGDGAATRVVDEAAAWISAHKAERFVVVVHARGGHPPWEAPPEQLKTLAPDAYTGPIEPGAHAAEILARARHVPPLVRFNDADRKRAWALHDYAVSSHDAALGRLLAALDEAGHHDDTAILVASDTGMDVAAHVPFGDAEPLDEGALASMLVVHSAGEVTPSHVRTPTSSIDIATTVLTELGLSPPASFEGEDLATAETDDGTRPLFASTATRQLVSWMGLLLRTSDAQSELCVPALDAACSSDAAPLEPLASEALRKLMGNLANRKRPPHAVPALDGKTAAALSAWGR